MTDQAIALGSLAPDFQLTAATGESVHLYPVLERSNVVLFFYFKAFTPVCTAEVCSFRDSAAEFRNLNAAIFGIASGGAFLTRRFAAFHRLDYPLLLDRGDRVRALYQVPKLLGFLPGRSTYVIGQNKRILNITHGGFESRPHIVKTLNFLRAEAGE